MHSRNYTLTTDYFSNYAEVCHLQEITSENTIKQLKASFGIPKILYSDNGSQYTSAKFKQFFKTWNF